MDRKRTEEIAANRLQIISTLLDPTMDKAKRQDMKERLSAQYGISERTIRRWMEAYREKGFDGLKPKAPETSGTSKIPEDLLEEAAHVVYDFRNKQHDYRGDQVPEPLRSKILARFAGRILEDEYTALSKFKETHRKALFDAIDPALSKEEQRSALADASRQAMKGCPASDNYMDSRSNTVIEENFELAYEEASLERKRRPSVKEINDVFGNKSTV